MGEDRYNGIGDCFTRVVKEQGVASLWRGNLANVIRYFPTQALNFSFKDLYKKWFNPFNPKTEPVKFFFGNCASGGAREFSGLVDCLMKAAKKDGPQGLYRGFGISVVGIVAYRATYFGMFDTGKALLFPDAKKANVLAMWAFAQVVTVGAGVASYPLDTVRRRLMMDSGRKEKMYQGTLDCFKRIYLDEGGGAFFKGALSNILRGTGGALVLVFYSKAEALVYG